MPIAKDVLQAQLIASFEGHSETPLLVALHGITDQEATYTSAPTKPTTEHIVRHIAWCKNCDCKEAFGVPMTIDDPTVTPDGDTDAVPWKVPGGCSWGQATHPGINGAIELLKRTHAIMLDCLANIPEDQLHQPLNDTHGSSAAEFFKQMIAQNYFHAAQIRSFRSTAANAIT